LEFPKVHRGPKGVDASTTMRLGFDSSAFGNWTVTTPFAK
jgi:hypothetical protein